MTTLEPPPQPSGPARLAREMRRSLGEVRSVIGTGGVMLAGQVLLTANGILVARVLGPSQKGAVTALLAWSQLLAALCSAGIAVAYLVRVPTADDAQDPDSDTLRTALANALVFSVVVGGAATLGLSLLLPRILTDLGPDTTTLAVLAAAAIPLAILGHAASMIHLALGHRGRFQLVTLAAPLTIAVIDVVLFVTSGLNAGRVVFANLAGTAVAFAVALAGLPLRRMWPDLRVLGRDLAFGAKSQVGGLFRIAHFRVDYLLMPAFLSVADLGVYATANNIMTPVSTLFGAAALLIVPRVAAMTKDLGEGPATVRAQVRFVRREALRYIRLVSVGGVLVAIVTPVFVPVVLGAPYRDATVMVWTLTPGYLFLALTTIIASASAGMRRPWIGIVADLTAVILTAALLPLLLPRLGAEGASITSTVAYMASAGAALVALATADRRARRGKGALVDAPAVDAAAAEGAALSEYAGPEHGQRVPD